MDLDELGQQLGDELVVRFWTVEPALDLPSTLSRDSFLVKL